MLIKCPECELQVSDKAISCPHCGYPLKPEAKNKSPRKKNKRRRLPNGFGQISEIKGRNLKKPFRAMVTVGKDENGRPICKPLRPNSYFETYNDAYSALVEFNKNPIDLSSSMTLEELYNRWSAVHYEGVKESTVRVFKSAWAYCSSIYSMKVADIRVKHIKMCIEQGMITSKLGTNKASPLMQARIKMLFNMLLDYAVEYELIDRNYARSFQLPKEVAKKNQTARSSHIAFTKDEMNILWNNSDDYTVRMLLIQCYSGWRPQELCELKLSDIDLGQGTMTGGSKTEAGKNRIVPIHSKISELVRQCYDDSVEFGSQFLFHTNTNARNKTGTLSSARYRLQFAAIIERLGLDPKHRPHDGRKHFVTEAKKAKMDEFAIKYIVGHRIEDLTERVYTEREVSWLKEEIEKIK